MTDATGTTIEQPRDTFCIPVRNFDGFIHAFGKLARRAERVMGQKIGFQVIGEEMKEIGKRRNEDTRAVEPIFEKFFTIKLGSTDKVVLNGWRFCATLQHMGEDGTIVRNVPGSKVELPVRFRNAAPHCDHCQTDRRRRDTYALRCETTGEWKQVGNSCLRDFLGYDPTQVAAMAEYLSLAANLAAGSEEADFEGGFGSRSYIETGRFLGHVAAMIRRFGWVSGGAARAAAAQRGVGEEEMPSTRNRAIDNMFPHPKADLTKLIKVEDADREQAAAALEWASALGEDGKELSEYEHNLRVLAKQPYLEGRSTGLAASIVSSYLNHLGRLERAATRASRTKNSKHVGTVGERLRGVPVELIGHTGFQTDFGYLHIYTFLTEGGDVLVWKSGTEIKMEGGDKAKLTGTVKKHSEFKGVAQTEVSRCKVEGVVKAPSADAAGGGE